MNNKYILSICIPTLNRESSLKKLLKCIVNQEGFTSEVSIMINDGPSSDNTTNMVKEFQSKYNNIFYIRNKIAVGMIPAISESINIANGKYIWLFGSDDLMSKVGLITILDIIKNNDPGIILSNRSDFIDENVCNFSDVNRYEENSIIEGSDEFISYLGKSNKITREKNSHFFTFMSIFCFKKELYIKNKKLFLEKYGKNYFNLEKNYFNYIIILFFNLFNEKIFIVKNRILVFARLGNAGWTFNSMDIINDLYFSIKVFRKNYNVTFRCNYFFYSMLLIWFFPSLGGIIRKNRFLKYFYKPLSKIIIYIFYK